MLKELQENPIFGTWVRFSPCNLVPNRSSSATKLDTTKEYVSPPPPCTSNLYMEPIGGQVEHICVSISKSGHGPQFGLSFVLWARGMGLVPNFNGYCD
jgi:hypothetical protein